MTWWRQDIVHRRSALARACLLEGNRQAEAHRTRVKSYYISVFIFFICKDKIYFIIYQLYCTRFMRAEQTIKQTKAKKKNVTLVGLPRKQSQSLWDPAQIISCLFITLSLCSSAVRMLPTTHLMPRGNRRQDESTYMLLFIHK